MKVTLRVYGHLAEALHSPAIDLTLPEGSTLGSLLDHVAERLGPHELQAEALHILVDGQDFRLLAGRETPLHHQVQVDLIPPFQGG